MYSINLCALTSFDCFIKSQPPSKAWLTDVSTGHVETFGNAPPRVAAIRQVVILISNSVECCIQTFLRQGLEGLGLGPGSVLCLWCSNHPHFWLLCLAAWECGAATLAVNCLIPGERLEEQLKEVDAKLLVCDALNFEEGLEVKNRGGVAQVVVIGMEEGGGGGATRVEELLANEKGVRGSACHAWDWDTSALSLSYTSRDGRSRVVQHTNKSLTFQVFGPKGTSNHWFDQFIGDTFFCGNWFFHFTGLQAFALSAVQGLGMYSLSDYSDRALLGALQQHSIANAVLYPWQIRMLCQGTVLQEFDLSSLRALVSGGAILGPTARLEILDRLPGLRGVRQAYGMKETGLLTYTYPRVEKSRGVGGVEVPDDHLMPLGLPNMWTSFKVVDRLSGQPVCGPDTQGELCVKTPQLFLGYRGEQEDIVDNEGYFHTGDLGYYDKDGVIHFVEQISSLISFWMYEVAPSVLESRLLSHGSVVDAAVIAVPDKENGHVPRGFVVLKPGHEETEENLINFLESRLQDHERLRGGLYYIPQIPRDENWKVAKLLLQQFEPPEKGQDQGAQLFLCPLPDSLQAGSPRARRAAEAAVSLLRPGAAALPEEIFGMKSRSRRGSQDNVLDAEHGKRLEVAEASEEEFAKEEEARGPPPLLVVGRPGEEEKGLESTKAAGKKKDDQTNRVKERKETKSETPGKTSCDDRAPLEYWVPVVVQPSQLESLVGAHPGVAKVQSSISDFEQIVFLLRWSSEGCGCLASVVLCLGLT